MKILLHVCCAPCSISCIESLRAEGIEPVLYWYNPNIHPRAEYVKRRDCLVSYAENLGLTLIAEDHYSPGDFILGLCEASSWEERAEAFVFRKRCAVCYRIRLDKAAAAAKENGFDAFSTTLLVSPYQDHELLRETAQKAAGQNGVEFLYRDFRPGFREGQKKARASGFYMQKYCGCIFSEAEAASMPI
jgi:predicted adenine nucleotide alpha hydrolase (AANH) superfamily ATPase